MGFTSAYGQFHGREQQPPDFWTGLLSGFMQARKEKSDSEAQAKALEYGLSPTNIDTSAGISNNIAFNPKTTTMQPLQSDVKPGLFGMGMGGQGTQLETPQMEFTQPKPMFSADVSQPSVQPQQAPLPSPVITQKARTISDTRKDYNKETLDLMNRARAEMGSNFAKAAPEIMRDRQLQWAQVKSDFDLNDKQSKLQAFAKKLPADKQNLVDAVSLGIPHEIAKLMFPEKKDPIHMANGSWVEDPNSPGGYRQIGKVDKAVQHVQLASGNIGLIQADGSIQDTGTPFYQKPVKGGGGGGSGVDHAYTQKFNTYKWASDYEIVPTGGTDMFGKPEMTRKQNNPELAKKLANELFGGDGSQEQSQQQKVSYTGNQGIDTLIDAARAKKVPEEQIAQAVQHELSKGQQQPAPQQQPVNAQFMGETVNGAVPGYQVQLPQVPQYTPAEEDPQRQAWLNTLRR